MTQPEQATDPQQPAAGQPLATPQTRQPTSVEAAGWAVYARWQQQNPTAAELPRAVQRQMRQAMRARQRDILLEVREAARAEVRLRAQTRTEAMRDIETRIARHEQVTLGGRVWWPGDDRYTWEARQQHLAGQYAQLHESIQQADDLLTPVEIGRAVEALHDAFVAPQQRPAVRVPWPQERWNPLGGLDRLRARVAARRPLQQLVARMQSTAQQTSSQTRATVGPNAWLTPQQTAAVNAVVDNALQWDRAVAAARSGAEVPTMSELIRQGEAAMAAAQAAGVPYQRVTAEVERARLQSRGEQVEASATNTTHVQVDAANPADQPGPARRRHVGAVNGDGSQLAGRLIQVAGGDAPAVGPTTTQDPQQPIPAAAHADLGAGL